MSYPLARPYQLRLDAFALEAGIHPQVVRRYVALGLLDADRDPAGELWFAPATLARAARVQRLRSGLQLNYAAIGLVLDLLDRIDELQAQQAPVPESPAPESPAPGEAASSSAARR